MNSILRPVHAKIILRQHIEFLNIHRLQEMNLVETIVCISKYSNCVKFAYSSVSCKKKLRLVKISFF